jgi:hypothetical protein
MTHRKVCPKCLKNLSLDKFKPRPNGTYSYCYACELSYYKDYNRKRYASPKARQDELKRTKDRYHATFKPDRIARKKELIRMMGGKCERCGYCKSAAALDFHHKDPKTKRRTVSHLIALRSTDAWSEAKIEASDCELLCSNCHREETYPGWDM